MLDEKVNMGDLTHKELLILLNERVQRIDARIDEYEKDILALKLQVTVTATKIGFWSSVMGFGAGILASFITTFFK